MNAEEAAERLKWGNRQYLLGKGLGDLSASRRHQTAVEGQHPFAVILTCADSRVIPEAIFSAGIGELFVIRVAGNTASPVMGSVEYAVEHLHCPLIVVMGHDRCGAVGAALQGGAEGYAKSITDEILSHIGKEKDSFRASCLHAERCAAHLRETFKGVTVQSAVYHTDTGEVLFLDEADK